MTNRDSGAFSPVPFDTRGAFHEHFFSAVSSAQREIWLADADFTAWPMNSAALFDALHQFLLSSRVNRVQVLVHQGEVLSQNVPRFMQLLRLFGHAILIRQPPESVASRFAEEFSFAIVDRARMVRRFHRSTMRGVAELHPNDVGPWVERFESLWDESMPGFSSTTLGLSP